MERYEVTQMHMGKMLHVVPEALSAELLLLGAHTKHVAEQHTYYSRGRCVRQRESCVAPKRYRKCNYNKKEKGCHDKARLCKITKPRIFKTHHQA